MNGARGSVPADLNLAGRIAAHRENFRIGVEHEAHDRYDTTVNRLILVLRDFYPPRLDRAAPASLPPLTALSTLARVRRFRDRSAWVARVAVA